MRAVSLFVSAIILLCGVLPLAAQDVDGLLSEAASAYQRRDFATAIDLWQRVEQSDAPQPPVYYNLARAYEYLNDWGPVRAYDLRARAYKNTFGAVDIDSDLQAALDRGWARQEIDTLHPLIWLKQTLYDLTRPVGWGLVGALLWTGFWGMLIIYIRKRVGRLLLIGLGSGVLLWFTGIGLKMTLDSALIEAVSLESTPVYSGPGSDYVILTAWAEGYDLYILQTRGEWAQVMRADGVMGWVERDVIREIHSSGS